MTFNQAYNLLDKTTAVMWTEEGLLTYPILYSEGDENVEGDLFLILNAADENGYEYQSDFYRKDNQNPRIEGNKLILVDEAKEEVEISLLTMMKLEDITFI